MPRELAPSDYTICPQWTPYGDPYSQSLASLRDYDNRYRPTGLRRQPTTPRGFAWAVGVAVGLAGIITIIQQVF